MSPGHRGTPLRTLGPPPAEADATLVLLHGRGASAEDILALGRELGRPTLACLAPQAAGGTWYPYSFLAPLEANQPWLDSALARVAEVVAGVEAAGVPPERIVLAGFSQGACLAAEHVARHPRRLGGVAVLTGGVQGPLGEPRHFAGDLAGTPVLLTAGDPDPHVPWERVEETAAILRRLGGVVDLHRYPGRPHTVSGEEVDLLRGLVDRVLGAEVGD